jgi:prepilin-type N-terminal cleavage/methylation domain-containing protein
MEQNTKKGFTLIEVILVLAIGGLIILMAILVFPNAMANLRDTQRREDYAQLSTAISQFSASNNGKLIRLVGAKSLSEAASKPLNAKTYINSSGEDPSGYQYELTAYTFTGWEGAGSPAPKDIHTDDTEAGGGEEEGDGTNYGSQVFVIIGADCDGPASEDGGSTPGRNNSTKAYAIYGYLETGSRTYCNASTESTVVEEE